MAAGHNCEGLWDQEADGAENNAEHTSTRLGCSMMCNNLQSKMPSRASAASSTDSTAS